ncbi:MAG: amidohydrolase family protein [Promethearchaeota archaeon]
MIIDANVHLSNYFIDPNTLLSTMDESGIDMSIIVPSPYSDYKTPRYPPVLIMKIASSRPFSAILYRLTDSKRTRKRYIVNPDNSITKAAVQAHPQRLARFAWINPDNPDFLSKLNKSFSSQEKDRPLGIKLHLFLHKLLLASQNVLRVVDYARTKKVPLLIDLGYRARINEFLDFLEVCEDLPVIIGHMGGKRWFRLLRETENKSNVIFEISPIYAVSKKMILRGVSIVGAERIIFASGAPTAGNQQIALERVQKLPIKETEKSQILGENAATLLGL